MSSAIQEVLRPVSIKAVEAQSAADPAAVTYIGLAHLLPGSLQALCSCAGLFFARVVSPSSEGDSVQLEVAALERYFDADDKTYDQHVRSLELPQRVFDRLLKWDKRLAALPTYEVREFLKDLDCMVGKLALRHSPLPQVLTKQRTTTFAAQQPVEQPQQAVQAETLEIETEPETVIIPFQVLQQCLEADPACQAIGKKYRPSRRWSLPRLLVRFALAWIKQQREEVKHYLDLGWREEQQVARLAELGRQRNRLRRALKQQNTMPVQVEILPIYAYGRGSQIVSCRIDVDVPKAA